MPAKIVDWWTEAYLPKVVVYEGKMVWGVKGRCYRWTGSFISSRGNRRPACKIPGTRKNTLVYRMIFIYLDGEIDPRLEVDHLCHRGWCVNYYHLDLVTRLVNQQRYGDLTTHCPNNHPYNKVNTKWYDRGNGRRACRVCHREREARRRALIRKQES